MFFLRKLTSFYADVIPPVDPSIAEENQRSNNAALLKAVTRGYTDIIPILLAAGANKDARSEDGYPLLQLAIYLEHLEIIRILLAAGVDIEAKNGDGLTAFMFAAQRGNTVVMNMLLTAGANINALSSAGASALLIAAFYGKADVIKVLLSAGANQALTMPDNSRWNALQLAFHEGHTDAIALLLTAHHNTVAERARLFSAIEQQVNIQIMKLKYSTSRYEFEYERCKSREIQMALSHLKRAIHIKNRAESATPDIQQPSLSWTMALAPREFGSSINYDKKTISEMDFSTIDSMLNFSAREWKDAVHYVRIPSTPITDMDFDLECPIEEDVSGYKYYPSLQTSLSKPIYPAYSSYPSNGSENFDEVKVALSEFRPTSHLNEVVIDESSTETKKNGLIWSWMLQAYAVVFSPAVTPSNDNSLQLSKLPIPDSIIRDEIGDYLTSHEKLALSRTSRRHHVLFQPELRTAKWLLYIAKEDQSNVEQMEAQHPELLSNPKALQIANNIGRTSLLRMGTT